MTTSTATLVQKLTEGKVSFRYTKSNGTVRDANGTLSTDLIPAAKRPGSISTDATAKSISYFDLDRNDWRAFRRDSLIG